MTHANDSAAGCGSRRDRHANIAAGEIGAGPMRALLHHRALADVPFVVETPGDLDAHARDIATLKALRDGPGEALRNGPGDALRDGPGAENGLPPSAAGG